MTCLHDQGTNWYEQEPKSIHAYRVECAACGLFLKWGNEAELQARITGDEVGWKIDYKAPASLDAFYAPE